MGRGIGMEGVWGCRVVGGHGEGGLAVVGVKGLGTVGDQEMKGSRGGQGQGL